MPVFEQGVLKDRYTLIPRVLVFATREDAILLIKGSPKKRLWPNLYNGIGGHIERGEDVLAAAKREFKEETGLDIINPWLCAVITIDTGGSTGIGMYVFRGETNNIPIIPSPEGNAEWVKKNQLEAIPLVEDLPILIPKILKKKREEPPLYANYFYDNNDKLIVKVHDRNSSQNIISIENLESLG